MNPREHAPRGKLHGVAPYVRHLWSVLYRATRRHAVRIDELLRRVDRAETRLAELRGETGAHGAELRRQVSAGSRLVDLEETCDRLRDEVDALRTRVHQLEGICYRGEGLP